MQKKFTLTYDGQALRQTDLNMVGTAAAHADDQALQAVLRMAPSTGSGTTTKALIPQLYPGKSLLIGDSGRVLVMPFRAVIGSRSADYSARATDGKAWFNNVRSVFVVDGTTNVLGAPGATIIPLASNSSGNPRWDLIYVSISPDTTIASSTVLRKDPTSSVVGPVTVPSEINTVGLVNVVQGTPAASPTFPALPTDIEGALYYIPIGYVRVPNGFVSNTTSVNSTDIAELGPVISNYRTLISTVNASTSTAQQQSWGSTGTRPNLFIPSTASSGFETRFLSIDLAMASGSVIDNSINWANRIFSSNVQIGGLGIGIWNLTNPIQYTNAGPTAYNNIASASTTQQIYCGFGQSFYNDGATVYTSGPSGLGVVIGSRPDAPVNTTKHWCIYCDTNGVLKFWSSASIAAQATVWLMATGQF